MEKECNFVTFSGVEYREVNRIVHDNNIYVLLVNLDDAEDFCIRKLALVDGRDYVKGLDSVEEFNRVFKLFLKESLRESFG